MAAGAGAAPLTGRRLWLAWIAATAGAEVVGFGLAAPLFGAGRWGPALAGLAEGACVGGVQALVLGRALPGLPRRWWWLVTAAIAVAGWGGTSAFGHGGSGPEPPLPVELLLGAMLGLGMGLVLGAGQWLLVLRRRVDGAATWIPASAVGWALGMVPAFAAATSVPAGSSAALLVGAGALAGGAMGGLAGLVTGSVLVRLVPESP